MNRHTQRLIIGSAILGVIFTAAAYLLADEHFALGVAAGAMLGTLNLRLWAVVVSRLVRNAANNGSKTGSTAALMIGKYTLIAAVFILLVFGAGLNVIALAIGISNVVSAILIEAILPVPAEDV